MSYRIGIDCRMYGSRHGGIGRYVEELVRQLISLDTANTYVLFMNRDDQPNIPPSGRVEIIRIQAPHYSFEEQTGFLRALNRAKLDLMHFTHFNAPVLYRGKYVVTIHDLTLHYFSGRRLKSFLRRMAYKYVITTVARRAARIIAVSHHTKKDIVTVLRVPEERVRVIYEAADSRFRPIVQRNILENIMKKYDIQKPFLLFTGNFTPHKNLRALAEGFEIAKGSGDLTCCLVIAGKPVGYYANQVARQIAASSVAQDILMPGYIGEDDFVPLMSCAHAYIFPSLYEGFGLPPLEAMACGVPVAASNATSIPEICGEDNALYFNPRDPNDIASALRTISLDEALRATLRQRGLERVQQFSWRKAAEETLVVYHELL